MNPLPSLWLEVWSLPLFWVVHHYVRTIQSEYFTEKTCMLSSSVPRLKWFLSPLSNPDNGNVTMSLRCLITLIWLFICKKVWRLPMSIGNTGVCKLVYCTNSTCFSLCTISLKKLCLASNHIDQQCMRGPNLQVNMGNGVYNGALVSNVLQETHSSSVSDRQE